MAGELPVKSLIYNGISATVAAADAVAQPIAGVRRATIFMTTTGNWPNTTSLVDVSADGTNWVTYNKIISNVTNTNAQTITRVATVACNNTTAIATLDLSNDAFAYMRIYPTRAAGNMTMYLVLEYF